MHYRKSLKAIESKMHYLCGNDMDKHFENVDKGLLKLKKCITIMSTRYFKSCCFIECYRYEHYKNLCSFNRISISEIATEEEFNFVREVVRNG